MQRIIQRHASFWLICKKIYILVQWPKQMHQRFSGENWGHVTIIIKYTISASILFRLNVLKMHSIFVVVISA